MRIKKTNKLAAVFQSSKHRIEPALVKLLDSSRGMAGVLTSLLFCSGAGALFLCSPGAGASLQMQDQAKLKDSEFISAGAKLFAPTCGSGYCHGAGGMGGGAPRIRGVGLDPMFAFKRVSDGSPGTAMMGFKEQFKPEDMWRLVAFVLSPAGKGPDVNSVATQSTPPARKFPAGQTPLVLRESGRAEIRGDSAAGKALFFDSANQQSCHLCHVFQGSGAAIGPDLSKMAASARDILISIVTPHEVKDSRFIRLTMKDGETIPAVKKEEDEDSIRVYDVTTLPAVLRTLQKENISRTELMVRSPMPADYSSRYTIKQMLDLVAFLKSVDLPAKPVSLRDIF